MTDKLRFAVIGVGGFGRKRVNSIMSSDSAQLTYVVDFDEKLAREVGQKTSKGAATFEELLSRSDFDVAIVAAPNKWHEDLVVGLLESGKTVWCEKPLSVTADSAKRMLEKAIETGQVLKVGSNVRYFPNVARAAQLIREGYLGRIQFFRGWIGNDGSHLLTKNWYNKKEMIGGGTLLDNGIHLVDLIRYLAGEVGYCDVCKCANLKWLGGLEDNAFAVYSLLDGGNAIIHSSWTEKSGYMYFEVHGEDGFIHVDCRWNKAFLVYGKSGSQPASEDLSKSKFSYDLELESFIDDYRKRHHPTPTSYDGYRAVKIISQSYSSWSGLKRTEIFDDDDRQLQKRFAKVFPS
jgi:predicted dehydrogenase